MPKVDMSMKYPERTEGDETLDFVRLMLEQAGYAEAVEPDLLDDLSEPKDPIEWIQKEFWIPETKGPLPLFPYQIAVIREAYRTDANGMFKYDTVIYSDIKKSAKSTIAAAVAAERARRLMWGYVRIVANSKDQAASRVFYYLERAIRLNPKLREAVKIKQYQMLFPGNTFVQAIPMNPKRKLAGMMISSFSLNCGRLKIWRLSKAGASLLSHLISTVRRNVGLKLMRGLKVPVRCLRGCMNQV